MDITSKQIKVVFFQRKPRPIHKSIENIFDDVRKRLPGYIRSATVIFRFYSQGLFQRLYIIYEAYRKQGDVNHVTGDIHFSAILLKKRKTMLTIHDCRLLSDTSGLKQFIFKTFWFTLPLKKCSLVTVVSRATKNELLKFINFPGERILIIPDAISTAFSFYEKTFNCTRPIILQVGTTINKNIHRLTEAIEGLNCQLNIIGLLSDEQRSKLQRHNIDYTNSYNLSEQELVKQYIKCDMVSFVSTYEGFGMPIIEANSIGRPVITSNILSMPDVAGDSACLVDPYSIKEIRDGIFRIINDENYREQLVRNGLINCQRFEPQEIANSYLECYKKLSGKFIQ